MRKGLLIVSHTEHYRRGSEIVGWGPTVREIDHLARLFDHVIHLAPLHEGPAPESALPYQSPNVTLRAVAPAGGQGARAKLAILAQYPRYAIALLRALRQIDVIHVRCPANISLLAIVLLACLRHPRERWVKYAGNWQPNRPEPWSYRFQRWLLASGLTRAKVTVNGRWPGQPAYIYPFLNPSLTTSEMRQAEVSATGKTLTLPVRLLYVGRVEQAKGAGRMLEIAGRLQDDSIPFHLDIVGDGPARNALEIQARSLGLQDKISFSGWLPRSAIDARYEQAHFILLPAVSSEGWPKVLSEAMAYGVVPIASAISSIPQTLQDFETGRCIDADNIDGFVDAIRWYVDHVEAWRVESGHGRRAAHLFSYDHYLEAVSDLLEVS